MDWHSVNLKKMGPAVAGKSWGGGRKGGEGGDSMKWDYFFQFKLLYLYKDFYLFKNEEMGRTEYWFSFWSFCYNNID